LKTLKNIASCCSFLPSLWEGLGMGFLFLFICSVGMGQTNLVPNGSFENYTSCPWNPSQISYATGWTNYSGSVDYYNSCAGGAFVSVPENVYGYQPAADGNAYAGIVTYAHGDTIYSGREVIGGQLVTSLAIGQKYFVSFKVSFSPNDFETGRAANKTGVLFSTTPYNPTNNRPPVNNFAHVYTDSIIIDTVNWTMIVGSFVADSTYDYLSIGNFFKNQNTDTIVFNSDTLDGCCSYYYIDDVKVSTDSNFVFTGIQEEPLKNNFNIYPNPVTDYFHINQPFTAPYDLIIYNTIGQKLYEEKDITTSSKIINTITFNKGLLLINIKSQNQSINYKLLKP
jgi:hypothetical protein